MTKVWKVALAGAMLSGGAAAHAQMLPVVAPDPLAARLKARAVETAMGFSMRGPWQCRTGPASGDWAYRCTAAMADAARGGRIAGLEVMIYRRGYDFAHMAAEIKRSVAPFGSRWKLEYQPRIKLNGNGRAVNVTGQCYQGRGSRNTAAYCLTPLGKNVTLFTYVEAAEASSDRITTSPNGGHDSFDDMARSGRLASLGAITVAKALDAGARPQKPNISNWFFTTP